MNCKSCGATLKENVKFCSQCGVKIEPDVCTKCNTPLKEGVNFALSAGQKTIPSTRIQDEKVEVSP